MCGSVCVVLIITIIIIIIIIIITIIIIIITIIIINRSMVGHNLRQKLFSISRTIDTGPEEEQNSSKR